jgi:hypothetical protein
MALAGRSGRRRTGWAVTLALALTVNACGTTATIVQFGGSRIEGRIVEGGRRGVTIVDQDGQRRRIPRNQIQKIDHPGGAAMGVGGGILGYGVVNLIVGAPRCAEKGGAYCTGVFLPAVVGAGILLWGIVVNTRSKNASEGIDDDTLDGRPPPNVGGFNATNGADLRRAPPSAPPPVAQSDRQTATARSPAAGATRPASPTPSSAPSSSTPSSSTPSSSTTPPQPKGQPVHQRADNEDG